ncbi:hypothetical protein C8R47DRAFT_1317238, partial [Mycena vitilis]
MSSQSYSYPNPNMMHYQNQQQQQGVSHRSAVPYTQRSYTGLPTAAGPHGLVPMDPSHIHGLRQGQNVTQQAQWQAHQAQWQAQQAHWTAQAMAQQEAQRTWAAVEESMRQEQEALHPAVSLSTTRESGTRIYLVGPKVIFTKAMEEAEREVTYDLSKFLRHVLQVHGGGGKVEFTAKPRPKSPGYHDMQYTIKPQDSGGAARISLRVDGCKARIQDYHLLSSPPGCESTLSVQDKAQVIQFRGGDGKSIASIMIQRNIYSAKPEMAAPREICIGGLDSQKRFQQLFAFGLACLTLLRESQAKDIADTINESMRNHDEIARNQ